LPFGPEPSAFSVAVEKLKNFNMQDYNFACGSYGCETWSLILREEHRLRVFENRVPRRIFGSNGDDVKGEWRKLHNEGLHDLYSSQVIIIIMKSMRMRWTEHVARIGEKGTRIGCWWESQRERDSYEDQNVGGWIL
jgi:hypothetical protein